MFISLCVYIYYVYYIRQLSLLLRHNKHHNPYQDKHSEEVLKDYCPVSRKDIMLGAVWYYVYCIW